MLQVKQIDIGYAPRRRPRKVVVGNIDLRLDEGELVCLIGPNGAGKTTLLRTLAGTQRPLAGKVVLDGADVHRMSARDRARKLSLVLTHRIDAGLLTGYALVSLGRYPHTGWTGRLSPRDHEAIRWAVRSAGAEQLADRLIGELSDGERQRVMIARALAQEPRLMILDEITAYLDLPRRVEMMELLRRLARSEGRTVLLSTHDLDLALRCADRLWLLPRGGPLHQGAPEDLVLNGAFEAAFADEGVSFDSAEGVFRLRREVRGAAELKGQGIEALWTRRALEREGLDVREAASNAPLRVEILRSDSRPHWRLSCDGESRLYDSLSDLAKALRSRRWIGGSP